ncbi:bestrophin-like domain [Alsobacter sp. R-9]
MRVDWFMNIVGHWPDGLILLAGATTTAATSVAVAFVARRVIFIPGEKRISEHAKLADIVHSSLLAFAVFVLALVLTDVRANMGKADDTVLREASTLSRLDRELQLIGGPAATAERKRLRDYAAEIVSREWPSLGAAEPALSADVTKTMTALIVGIRSIAASTPDIGSSLTSLLDKLDDLRQTRLESATRTVPAIFWWLIGVFLLGAMVLNGRHSLDAASLSLITLHMAAIGLVIAFIVVMDEPFRGESSIRPDPILHALGPLPTS